MGTLTGWLTRALKDGVINRNEYREALNYPLLSEKEFDIYTVPGKLNPLDRAMEEPPAPVMGPQAPLKVAPKVEAEKKAGFDPNQARADDGKWGAGAGEPKGFEKSKVRDENGNLKKVYHGTKNGDFKEFDLDFESIRIPYYKPYNSRPMIFSNPPQQWTTSIV